MKNHLMPLLEKVLLRKRFIIESLFDKLKSSMGVEHSRQRSPINALVHIVSCLAAYSLAQRKVKIGNIPIPDPMPPSLPTPDLIQISGSLGNGGFQLIFLNTIMLQKVQRC